MVQTPEDHDTWSVGSFLRKPVIAGVPARDRACTAVLDVKGPKACRRVASSITPAPSRNGHELVQTERVALSNDQRPRGDQKPGWGDRGDIMKFAAHIREGVEARFDIRWDRSATSSMFLLTAPLPYSRAAQF